MLIARVLYDYVKTGCGRLEIMIIISSFLFISYHSWCSELHCVAFLVILCMLTFQLGGGHLASR